ncbi:signal peptidase I [Sphingomicrobium aestuariivivum]|uniref:signal peptidase I n=1 Tax=Sphingomicrobium aestuariivivum TaxID=1582356 RepID=UPI001FD652F6|nr:signal peptidase I [Sphingomicrobium aestuariivivum]MCJ8190276.1 signal peptidase I [Sphingomicrobium aestuariivivum]
MAKAKEKKPETLGSLTRFLLGLALFAWVLRSFIVAPFSIPSGSMLPTMWIGDYLFVGKWPYGYSKYSFPFGFPDFDGRIMASDPERGDVVVFRPPGQEDSDFVKRVIGLPGDRVELRDGIVILNGEPVARERLERDFAMPISPNSPCRVVDGAQRFIQPDADGVERCFYPAFRETLPSGRSYTVLDQRRGGPADDRAPITVPDGHYFLMGDNRDDSLDSRFQPVSGGVGLVPAENLVGRALGNFWSTDGSASWFLPWTWFTALRPGRIGIGYGE